MTADANSFTFKSIHFYLKTFFQYETIRKGLFRRSEGLFLIEIETIKKKFFQLKYNNSELVFKKQTNYWIILFE